MATQIHVHPCGSVLTQGDQGNLVDQFLDAASINTHASGDVAHGGLLSCIVGEHERLAIDPRGQPDGELTTETDTHRQDMVGHTATWMQRGPYSGEGDVGKVEVLFKDH
jgi:hypothetical protein